MSTSNHHFDDLGLPERDVDPDGGDRRIRRTTVLAVAMLFVVVIGFWAWVFMYQLQNKGEDDMPDRLDDLAWTAEADELCAAAVADVAELPSAQSSPSAEARADVIDEATARFERMLADLEDIAPTGSSRDAAITEAWLADYRQFLDDRYTFADSLRDDPMARFLVTEKYGSHITKPIDRFARVNEMEACMSPGDV